MNDFTVVTSSLILANNRATELVKQFVVKRQGIPDQARRIIVLLASLGFGVVEVGGMTLTGMFGGIPELQSLNNHPVALVLAGGLAVSFGGGLAHHVFDLAGALVKRTNPQTTVQ